MKLFYCTRGVLFLSISLGKFEMIIYCIVGDFLFQSYTVKVQNDGRILLVFRVNDFTILSKLSLFIQNFVKYLCEGCAKKEFFLLFLSLVNNGWVFSSIIRILNFSSQPIFESVKNEKNLKHGSIKNWNIVADLYLK